MHNKLPYRCDVLQIKDGELDQELVMQEVLKYLAEKSEKVDNDKLKEAVRTCAEKSKL
jgi:predicted nucleotidyltransferase